MQQRFGGYWRFPNLLDFCYLVNPYFPKKNMIKEIMHNFNPLLRDYPSGLATQNLLASRMFGIREDSILTGNGAAELINALMGVLSDQKVGFILPSFNEYAERHESTKSVLFQVEDENFAYGKEQIIRWSDSVDTLVLINPDNPSGNFIPLNDLYEILDSFKERNKRLMLDESFVDFSTGGPENSIISNENLEKYSNLVVIKSISKSYGVPGIRLGIMATSDKELLEKVKKRISIWNINSFGEFFMQIYSKYENSYIKSCRKIADERDRFFTKLETIPWLTPHSSQANYFLCDVEGFNTTRLVDFILKEHSIFLKDLRGKKGFEQKNCIRIAVRSKEDNKRLIRAFRSLSGKSIL
jgi:histidinol-phosphate/aromatic aminotransferase/cobyric acid decarboxylase-like protein